MTPRAKGRPDRGGDPLDGLVNLFDLGVVLAVAFLLAALSSLHLEDTLTKRNGLAAGRQPAVRVGKDERARPLGARGGKVLGHGEAVGTVYRLDDGRLVYTERKP